MERQEEYNLISKVILYDDHHAFEALMEVHQNGIKNLLLKLLNFNERELDDLFQDTCTKIYRHMKSFKGASSFATWAYRIAYNTFLNAHQRQNRFQTLKDKLTFKKAQHTIAQQDRQMDIEKMIAILRPEEKAAIQLAYIQGFSHKDVAEILDCPVGTVKSYIKRGKERIAKTFNTYQP